jgi:uncharacterized protein (TIGR00725 family)
MAIGPTYIAVIGSGQCGDDLCVLARRAGDAIARAGAILVCGGLGGVMDAAAEGAQSAGGLTVGILPDHNRVGASRHLTVSLPSGMGEMRNALVVRAADALVAIGGEYGTLSEIGLALKIGKPVVAVGTWDISKDGRADESIMSAETPEEAVAAALKAVAV